jgi:hypothetical protein
MLSLIYFSKIDFSEQFSLQDEDTCRIHLHDDIIFLGMIINIDSFPQNVRDIAAQVTYYYY